MVGPETKIAQQQQQQLIPEAAEEDRLSVPTEVILPIPPLDKLPLPKGRHRLLSNFSYGKERKVWRRRGGSGRSRRQECEECSRGRTKEHACKRNMLSTLKLPIFWRWQKQLLTISNTIV